MKLSFVLAAPGLRWVPVWRRHLLVWRKLLAASVLGNLADPLIMLLGLGWGLGALLPGVDGMSYMAFLAAGSLCSSAMMTASFESMFSAYSRMDGQRTWEGILHSPLSIDDVVTGEIVWAATKGWLTGAMVLAVVAAFGLAESWTALLALPVAFLVGLTFSCIGMVMTVLARNWDFFSFYLTLVLTPMTMISGVFFPMDRLPEPLQALASVLPLHHAVALVRPAVAGQWPDNAGLHVAVLVFYATIAFGLALGTARKRFLT